ncbi:hypothetical protein DMB42_29620 [Nonomuraea sp. WAC 01424]|uniref:hypothetical protein n=1 Tax=Nonomuraea sp. WAC 01424 TaxID=2203200 RepID=UPI000F77DAED|nr:hypothetical protein [Nonomuraea sp. WAC 01424]RSN04947.1 hypothetical protein DMB42_29620 [Nonomuraea sp. WAC 01424]
MVDIHRPRRWPAYALAALMLGYAAGKADFAAQGRLGFPGGPPVPAAEAAGYFLDPSLAQWFAAGSGVLRACVALATVTAAGRRLPRGPLLAVLAVMLLAVGGGAAIMILDGFVGIGIGWRWYHGVAGIVVIVLGLETARSYLSSPRRP